MKQLQDDSIALLRDMVRIPSVSSEEQAVSDMLLGRLSSFGLDVRRVGRNLVCMENFDPSLPTLALDAHLDTVSPQMSYSFDPYDPGEDPSVVRGLGSNDDGASVVSMIAAYRFFRGRRMPFNLVLTLSCEEECSGPGGVEMLYGKGKLLDPQWMIIGEPTQMRAATSERGLLVLDCHASGVSGHAAREEGVNALYIALEDIVKLRAHVFDKVSPTMGSVKLSVTQISAGKAHNVVPDSCDFVVDIRPNECYAPEDILRELQAECRSKLCARSLNHRSSCTPEDSELLKTASRLGLETFSSPTTSNWMCVGCEAVKMGPGDSSRSHKADEFVFADEIRQGICGYIDFIADFYGNTLE